MPLPPRQLTPTSTPAWIPLGGVVLLALAVFSPALGHAFVDWDDHVFLRQNPDLNPPTLAALGRYWTGAFRSLYQPVPYSLWWLIAAATDHAPGGDGSSLDPLPFHAANLIAHAIAAAGAFGALRVLTGRDLPAALGAAVFAVHPLQAEPVNWASSFYTCVNGALGMNALWLYLLHVTTLDRPDPRRRARFYYPAATLLCVLAMLSKPSGVMLPVIAALLDRTLLRRDRRAVARSVLPWLLLAIPVAITAKLAQPSGYVDAAPLASRPLIALDALAFYLCKLVWPVGLGIDYGRTPQRVLDAGTPYWAWIAPAGIAALAWTRRRARPWIGAAALTFAAGVLPFLGLVKFEFQWYSTVADRYLYLSMLAPALVVAHLAMRSGRTFTVVAAAIVGVLAVGSVVQSRHWSDTTALMARALAVNPDSLVGHNVSGYRAAARGDDDAASRHFLAALRVRPDDAAAHFNFGNLLLRQDRVESAAEHFEAAIRRKPYDAQVRTNWAIASMRLGRHDVAEREFREAVRLSPRSAATRANLAGVLLTRGRRGAAAGEYREALRLDPTYAPARRGLEKIRASSTPPASPPPTNARP